MSWSRDRHFASVSDDHISQVISMLLTVAARPDEHASAGMQGLQKAGLISLGQCITRACTHTHMHTQVGVASK